MGKRLVDHLQGRGRTAGAASILRRLWVVTPRRLRRLAVAEKAQPVARVLLGLAAAFVCGVGLGVGVAALFAPDRVETAARVAGAAGKGAGVQRPEADPAPYAVEVRVRQEKETASSSAAAGNERAQDAPPADRTSDTPAVKPAAKSEPGVRLVAKPTPQYPSEEAATNNPALVPPRVMAPDPPAAGAAAAPMTPGESVAPDAPVQLPPHPAPKSLELAALPMPRDAAWIRNAVRLPDAPRDVVIAIIIDDMGIDQKRSKLAIGLPAPLTLSFIPYGYHLDELVAAARAAGHEVMLHLPMEPMDPEADPGPNALKTTVSLEENHRRLQWALGRFEGFVGLNNHMGSKFTAWRPGMELVMAEVQARGLLFVDSFTNNESVGYALARQHKLPSASRDVFIDHDISRAAIEHSFDELERIARRRGYAVGIAHPHDLSREMLRRWIIDARSRGIDFVPISHIARRAMKTG